MPSKNNIRRTDGTDKDGFFRKAGDKLQGVGEAIQRFDQGYSDKINAMYKGAPGQVRGAAALVGGGSPAFKKASVQRPYGPETVMDRTQRQVVEYGVPVANAAVKYGLPAAGVTLAGKGLIDISTALAQPGMNDQQTEGTMSL